MWLAGSASQPMLQEFTFDSIQTLCHMSSGQLLQLLAGMTALEPLLLQLGQTRDSLDLNSRTNLLADFLRPRGGSAAQEAQQGFFLWLLMIPVLKRRLLDLMLNDTAGASPMRTCGTSVSVTALQPAAPAGAVRAARVRDAVRDYCLKRLEASSEAEENITRWSSLLSSPHARDDTND